MKFSIRDLLLVTVIVALAVGWWVDHRRQAALREEYRIVYEGEVRRMEENESNLAQFGISIERGEYGEVRGVIQNGIRLPRLPNSSAPAPNSPKQ